MKLRIEDLCDELMEISDTILINCELNDSFYVVHKGTELEVFRNLVYLIFELLQRTKVMDRKSFIEFIEQVLSNEDL